LGPSEFQLVFVTLCTDFVSFYKKKLIFSCPDFLVTAVPLWDVTVHLVSEINNAAPLYRVILEDRSIFWEVIVSVIVTYIKINRLGQGMSFDWRNRVLQGESSLQE
jgi:hypothetical protein